MFANITCEDFALKILPNLDAGNLSKFVNFVLKKGKIDF